MSQTIGANIKARRLEAGITQKELAAKLGCTQANISRLEDCVRGPHADTLITIADILGCTVLDLISVGDKHE